jgi:hypothetical protein
MYPKQVRCIDVSGHAQFYLTLGQIYTAVGEHPKSSDDYMLDIQNAPKSWSKTRFEDVVAETTFTPFKVECVDNDNEISYLHVGSIYTVLHQSDRYYYLEGIAIKNSDGFWNGGMRKERFIVVNGVAVDPTIAVNDHTCPTCGNNRCSKSEKTCWRCGGVL